VPRFHLFMKSLGESRVITLRQERPGHTLQGTALVHEAYLRLEKQGATDFKTVNIFWRSALN